MTHLFVQYLYHERSNGRLWYGTEVQPLPTLADHINYMSRKLVTGFNAKFLSVAYGQLKVALRQLGMQDAAHLEDVLVQHVLVIIVIVAVSECIIEVVSKTGHARRHC